jgi:MFS family permease
MRSPVAAVPTPVTDRLGRSDIKTLALAALGGALEFYDFVVFVFLALPLSELFFPKGTSPWLAQLQVYGIFAAGYLARPLGGIVMAHYGDLLGRKRMFALSVFLMALPTLLIGLLPVYAQIGVLAPVLLLVLRVLQGIAVGGEVPGAWVFVAEHVPPSRVGLACASLTSGLTVGILFGSLLTAAIHERFDHDTMMAWGWRLPFLLGGVFGFVAVWLRRWLRETPVFEAMHAQRALADELPLRRVLRMHRGAVARSMVVTWTLTAAIVVAILMTPTLAQAMFHLPAATAFLGNSLASAALAAGCLVYGALADRLGIARVLGAGAVLLALAVGALYLDLQHGAAHFLPLYALAGFCVGVVGVVPAVMVAEFPPVVRFSGLSFSYNVAYAVFGGITPPLIGAMVKAFGPLAPAYYVALAALAALPVAVMLRRRTAG